ncbi:sensor histidine kinase [Halonotius pteroides]|uniref:sensor histidine kinase n=1 Tax=Halonotius pteroides TaxID=268735 RepID=UPI001F0C810B|nr:ATP-binding protein [Halonotius pteroides]
MAALVGQCWSAVETDDAAIEIVDEMTFEGDPGRVRHVFENLFRNAVEHGGAGVTVRVGSHEKNGLYLEDDGAGIPVGKREHVLEPGHSSARGGTGFGLTIVRRIVEAHGWELSITGGIDGGARFEIGMDDQDNLI